jgi:hypothetical protein
VFLAPSGALGCYIPRIEWSQGLAVVPLLGPDCGFGAQEGLINAVAVVDPATSRVSELTLISRKGFLMSSGRWAAAIASSPEEKATTFFSLQDPARSVTLPLWRLADYCCAP